MMSKDDEQPQSGNPAVQSLRDIQHQRWLQQKNSTAGSGGPTNSSSSSSGGAAAAPPGDRASSGAGGSSGAPASGASAGSVSTSATTSSDGRVSSSSSSGAGTVTRGGSSSSTSNSVRSPKRSSRESLPLTKLENPDAPFLRKVHILPLGIGQRVPDNLLSFLKPCLSKFRQQKRMLYTGMVFEHEGKDFVVMKTDPEPRDNFGILGPETEYYFAGPPVARFKRIQFSALTNVLRRVPASSSSTSATEEGEGSSSAAPAETLEVDEDLRSYTTEKLFQELIAPYFQAHSDNEKQGGIFKLLNVNETITIKGVQFVVMATDPQASYGIVDKETLIYVDKDDTPEYKRIHIVPFQDTLPRSYQYDVFNDYLKPYCKAHVNQRYRVNDVFTYNAVQFKVVCCDPEELGGTNNAPGTGARIGRNTTVYCEGVLHPQLRDLLPPELVAQLAYLPPGLQMLLLSTDAVGGNQELFERLMEVQDMLQQRRGMSEETISNVEKVTIDLNQLREDDGQLTCMVCLCEFEDQEEARRLPCRHTFHAGCIDEWLRRSCECPICKHNVDRTLRNY
ncbi:unnamed protein product [Amoebophrya sp. A25]|nr:unnamed protein product [Amoebophrya sp. A25]|eukprot:GSA25T00021618001.1